MEEVAEIGRKKFNRSVRHRQPGEHRRHRYRDARSIEENENMVEELQQHMFCIKRKIPEIQLNLENAKSKASYTLDYGWSYGEKFIYTISGLDRKKMELEKLTFAHGAYRDKKAVVYFSSGEPEVNIHNLNYRMLHEARSVGGERRILNMVKPNKHSYNSGFSLKELDEQIWRLDHALLMKWRLNNVSDPHEISKKLMKLIMERERLFRNAPIKGSLWNSLPSTMDLRNQIQVNVNELLDSMKFDVTMAIPFERTGAIQNIFWVHIALETSKEKRIKVISEKRKELHSNKKELKKAEKENKSLRKTMERIRQMKQKALESLSHHKESV